MSVVFETTAVSFTRPSDATAYASGDLVANSTTAASVTPLAFSIPQGRGIKLWGARLSKTTTTITNATFKLHLYRNSPVSATNHGDNASWSTDLADYQGSVTIDASVNAFTDGVAAIGAVTSPPQLFSTDADQILYGLLTATAAYAPGSAEVFTIQLLGEAV